MSSKLTQPSPLWEKLFQIVETASETLRQHFQSQRNVSELKADLSPVCDADLAIHDYLLSQLPSVLPFPIVSEEQPFLAQPSPRVWLIDPLDGTKEFLRGSSHFCINIAVIEDGRPIVGLIAEPMAHRIYFAVEHEGAFEKTEEGWRQLRSSRSNEYAMVTSFSHSSSLEQRFQEEKNIKSREVLGSALKFIKLIKGESNLYPRFVPCRTWDVAAGHCLLKEVGGDILDFVTGEALRYQAPWDKSMAPFLAIPFAMETQELSHLRDFTL